MGRCWRCDTELRLVGNQWLCDNCDEAMGYKCWKCKYDFTVRDPLTKKNINQCSACGFYHCPDCGSCDEVCPKNEWIRMVFNILAGQTTLDGDLIITNPQEKVKRIIQFVETLKTEKRPHKVCPYYVYASYARGRKGEQGRIKQLLARMNGIGVKSRLDAEKFREKLNSILGIDINSPSFTVDDLREEGRYGKEERDACALGVCMRELEADLVITKKGHKAIVYKRIDVEGQCPYLRQDNFITKRCPNCHKDYNNPQLEYYQPNLEFCPNCSYKRGKKKGNSYPLIVKETNTFTCNCPYNEFISVDTKEEDENGESEEE